MVVNFVCYLKLSGTVQISTNVSTGSRMTVIQCWGSVWMLQLDPIPAPANLAITWLLTTPVLVGCLRWSSQMLKYKFQLQSDSYPSFIAL